jgi:DNA-binding CsgD family transcriptional regulator/PAS domain-containing protein
VEQRSAFFRVTVHYQQWGQMRISEKQDKNSLTSLSTHFPDQRLISTLDDSGVGLVIFDRRLRYMALNHSLAEIHNLPIKAHLGHSLHQVLGGFAEKVAPLWEIVFATGRPVGNLEIIGELPKRQGVGRWIHSFFPLKDIGGRVTRAGCFVIEVNHPSSDELALATAATHAITPKVEQPASQNQSDAKLLSGRERQVLRLLAEGSSNKQVSSALHISTRTVETYRARLMLKLNAPSFAQLVHYAIKNQIVEI